MSSLDKVRQLQEKLISSPLPAALAKQQPDMLYIGCIDARLDPIRDIGIDQGHAFIFRNIGALVSKSRLGDEKLGRHSIPENGEIPLNVSLGAALEFFIDHVPSPSDKIKHIVISGHTDCNGLKTCLHDRCNEHDHYLPLYLETLAGVRTRVIETTKSKGLSDEEVLHALEKESVRQSLANLTTYPVVIQAMKEGRLELHGWILDTATRRIYEMNAAGEFKPMVGA